jgi:hypothetical protein
MKPAQRAIWSFAHFIPKELVQRVIDDSISFAIAAFTVIPIAYYAIALRQHPELSFSEFWWKTVTVGPWQSGPIGFVWVLLAFDLTASLMYRISPRLLDPINRLSQRAFDRPADFFLFMLVVTAIVYVPARLCFGPSRWFEFGPFDVQASRVLLYECMYRKLKLGRSGDEVRPGWRVN